MKDLQKYFKLAKDELDVLEIPYGNITKVIPNSRAKRRYGQCCRKKDGTYEINISVRLLEDYVPTKSLMEVLIHEILHSCKGCMNHGDKWKEYAEYVNDCYAYDVQRCGNDKRYGLKPLEQKRKPFKYVVTCNDCGRKFKYRRQCYWFENPKKYVRCNCGSNNLIVVQNY